MYGAQLQVCTRYEYTTEKVAPKILSDNFFLRLNLYEVYNYRRVGELERLTCIE